MPRTLHTYTVIPSLPEPLVPLKELAYNLRWAWNHPTVQLFQTMNETLWERCDHNPARFLGLVSQARLEELAHDSSFRKQLETVYQDFRNYMDGATWWGQNYAREFGDDFRIAYFSAEFGLTECLPIYSGGLGVLAGDHLKAASDLGLPLTGIGFLYQKGYFRQGLNADGWQVEMYPTTDFYSLPISPVLTKEDTPLTISVKFPGRWVQAQVWQVNVGRIKLYLLDTNLPQNTEADRFIAGNLYGGDNETRIQQEVVLGIGGIHALEAMDLRPAVCHMNEGHSAFLALERVRRLIGEDGLTFADATEATAAGNVFTTHTPVPAGFDLFPADLVYKYFSAYAGEVGIRFDELMDRGRRNPGDPNEKFNMAVLAFRHARAINGVSRLHGEVSRKMAQSSYPEFPLDEVPVGSVTNGIHIPSFLSPDMADLFQRHLGDPTPENLADPAYWARVDSIPDAELWETHCMRRRVLVDWARKYLVERMERRGASEWEVATAREVLDPDVLTIGFARRFATYKRGDLLLRDPDRLKRILNHPERPVQLVFAGKAHPRDDGGKQLIQRIVHFAREESVKNRIVFLEDYDIAMARYLVQGVDIWLNNPRRPQEASGTSGMKVVPNGGLNFSILDGWWAEGYDPTVGWEIGRGEEYADLAYQDHVEAQDIYETLERDIAPLFYERGPQRRESDRGVPPGWVAKMKASMKKLAPFFNTSRMVREYTEKFYIPAARRENELSANDFAVAKELVRWKAKMRQNWSGVQVLSVEAAADKLAAGQEAGVRAVVQLGLAITPNDVSVQLFAGPVDANRNLIDYHTFPMTLQGPAEKAKAGTFIYTGTLPSERSGQQGYTVRVLPYHPDAVIPQELPLIAWE
ncbi:MAG: glycosyltransferase family 1 protein [Armatimonadaceae bacterium]